MLEKIVISNGIQVVGQKIGTLLNSVPRIPISGNYTAMDTIIPHLVIQSGGGGG